MKAEDSEILRRLSVFRFLSDEHFDAIEPLLQEEQYGFGDVLECPWQGKRYHGHGFASQTATPRCFSPAQPDSKLIPQLPDGYAANEKCRNADN
jgi:hypothetical protein